ncbi:MAG: hypothetical protein CSB44_05925 [Gammaproteobacteria bacterium]|nr:MAG: hypothetical protein CSB44_05925 [Gammaproteobacteria bacterium]PIE37038.1 MAG: hypothetical protein CSA54_02285 [Gammaproteobacteria bacterium]
MNTPVKALGASIALSLLLAACSSDDDDTTGGTVGESASGRPASEASDLEIRRNAANLASTALGTSLGDALDADVNGNSMGDGVDNPETVDDDIDTFLTASLGLESGNANVSREGDLVTIDPDESVMCREALAERSGMVDDLAVCEALFRDLSVEVAAVTDDTGSITYLFQQQPVVMIDYAPEMGAYELSLPGYMAALQQLASLQGDTEATTPETVEGALRVEASTTQTADELTSVGISLSVSEPLRLIDTASGTDISIAASELVSFVGNMDGSSTMTSNIGAVDALFEVSNGLDETPAEPAAMPGTGAVQEDVFQETSATEETQTVQLLMSSFTADMSWGSMDSENVQVNNVGFGESPMQLFIDGEQEINLSLNNTSFTVENDTISFLDDLTLGAMLGNAFAAELLEQDPEIGGASAEARVTIPAGTVLTDEGEVIRVNAGSVSMEAIANGENDAISESAVVEAGGCFSGDDIGGDDVGADDVSGDDADSAMVSPEGAMEEGTGAGEVCAF